MAATVRCTQVLCASGPLDGGKLAASPSLSDRRLASSTWRRQSLAGVATLLAGRWNYAENLPKWLRQQLLSSEVLIRASNPHAGTYDEVWLGDVEVRLLRLKGLHNTLLKPTSSHHPLLVPTRHLANPHPNPNLDPKESLSWWSVTPGGVFISETGKVFFNDEAVEDLGVADDKQMVTHLACCKTCAATAVAIRNLLC